MNITPEAAFKGTGIALVATGTLLLTAAVAIPLGATLGGFLVVGMAGACIFNGLVMTDVALQRESLQSSSKVHVPARITDVRPVGVPAQPTRPNEAHSNPQINSSFTPGEHEQQTSPALRRRN